MMANIPKYLSSGKDTVVCNNEVQEQSAVPWLLAYQCNGVIFKSGGIVNN